MDAKACSERSDAIRPMSPELANIRADTTIVAATDDDVNRTPSPPTTSADRHLKRFTKAITKRRQPRTCTALAHQAKQGIVAQTIADIPATKRGEYLVMKRLELSRGMPSPSTLAKEAYDSGDLAHMQALRELFALVGDVGVRKQRQLGHISPC